MLFMVGFKVAMLIREDDMKAKHQNDKVGFNCWCFLVFLVFLLHNLLHNDFLQAAQL